MLKLSFQHVVYKVYYDLIANNNSLHFQFKIIKTLQEIIEV